MSQVHASPHALSSRTTGQIMGLVLLAIAPATLAGFWHFGWSAFLFWSVCIVSCLGFEALCLKWAGKRVMPVLFDGSALLTGWLMAMSILTSSSWAGLDRGWGSDVASAAASGAAGAAAATAVTVAPSIGAADDADALALWKAGAARKAAG